MVGEPFGFFYKCAVCLCVQPKVYMYSEAKQCKKKIVCRRSGPVKDALEDILLRCERNITDVTAVMLVNAVSSVIYCCHAGKSCRHSSKNCYHSRKTEATTV